MSPIAITSARSGRGDTLIVRLGLELHDLLPLLAQAVDAERDDVAGLEEFRLGLHAQPNARRSSSYNDVTGLHDEILRARPDDVPAVEDHGLGVAALAFFSVDVEPHFEVLRILDLVLGDEPRSHRDEGLAALALG